MNWDICNLQLCQSSIVFNKAIDLFSKKWLTKEKAFIEYLTKNWVKAKHGWYEGYSVGDPSQSNTIESTHKHMKDFKGIKTRHPCIKFMKGKGKELLEECSKSRAPFFNVNGEEAPNPNVKVYYEKP